MPMFYAVGDFVWLHNIGPLFNYFFAIFHKIISFSLYYIIKMTTQVEKCRKKKKEHYKC